MQQEAIFFQVFFFHFEAVGRTQPSRPNTEHKSPPTVKHPKKGVEGQEVKKEETLYYIY